MENGGDIPPQPNRQEDRDICRKFQVEIGLLVRRNVPCGICTSSGTVGHSLSFGKADAALVVSRMYHLPMLVPPH